jgi:hypothetical protein
MDLNLDISGINSTILVKASASISREDFFKNGNDIFIYQESMYILEEKIQEHELNDSSVVIVEFYSKKDSVILSREFKNKKLYTHNANGPAFCMFVSDDITIFEWWFNGQFHFEYSISGKESFLFIEQGLPLEEMGENLNGIYYFGGEVVKTHSKILTPSGLKYEPEYPGFVEALSNLK